MIENHEDEVRGYMDEGMSEEEARAKAKRKKPNDFDRLDHFVRGRQSKDGTFHAQGNKDLVQSVVSYVYSFTYITCEFLLFFVDKYLHYMDG